MDHALSMTLVVLKMLNADLEAVLVMVAFALMVSGQTEIAPSACELFISANSAHRRMLLALATMFNAHLIQVAARVGTTGYQHVME